ncbi:MAG: histidinol-phosphate transaminase [Thermodesulfobacteriota bacterium]|nr:histidinol-phosphate transaminase [Thermodesulfobacteriota bacterium]
MKLNVVEGIKSIKTYVPGKPVGELEREYGISESVKLASNENPCGPSPLAVKAVQDELSRMNRYPDGSACELTGRLAGKFNVKPENIVIGNGSDDLISLLAHAFLPPGSEALMPFPSFLMYEISVMSAGALPVKVPLNGFSIDLSTLADHITDKTAMVFLTNPNNPTGSWFSIEEFNEFIKKLPDHVLVIADEAYIEFAGDTKIFNSLARPLSDKRVISLRTFSKAYGLAGLRIGYGVMAPEIADILHRIRQPFNVNALAQTAAAAALEDEGHLEKSLEIIHKGVDFLQKELTAMGLETYPTQANFFLVDVKTDAAQVFKALLEQGVIVRAMGSYGFNTCLRVNAGLETENLRFIAALKKVLA